MADVAGLIRNCHRLLYKSRVFLSIARPSHVYKRRFHQTPIKRVTRHNHFSKEQSANEKLSTSRALETVVFELLCDGNEGISVGKFLNILKETGLRKNDFRLKEMMANFAALRYEHGGVSTDSLQLEAQSFKKCVQENIVLVSRALRSDFVIPEFSRLTQKMDEIYWNCRTNNNGKLPTYIPQLARVSPDKWGMSLCTVDGQRYSIGDNQDLFTIQSASKPLTYALALQELGPNIVHHYIGQEPSGTKYNELSLNANNRPHNPMINSGAIACVALVKSGLKLPDRFDYIYNQFKRMAGGENMGFSNAVFLSERDSADRNFALAYYMKENKCFPAGTSLSETMDLYLQLCSTEINCESGAVIAATLANGGVCPTTDERIVHGCDVRNTLSLMHSCGMYDYSGQFAFRVGLPGKSGVSGVILLVIPNVMGICLWSPLLDACGNSCRGLQFIQEMVEVYNFHNYDSLQHNPVKIDPRRRELDTKAQDIVSLLFSAYSGDVTAVRRYAVGGMNMGLADYDGRTALHLAAAEGHLELVKFLLAKCGVDLQPKDRWGFTPLDDSVRFDHKEVQLYLESRASETDDDLEEKTL